MHAGKQSIHANSSSWRHFAGPARTWYALVGLQQSPCLSLSQTSPWPLLNQSGVTDRIADPHNTKILWRYFQSINAEIPCKYYSYVDFEPPEPAWYLVPSCHKAVGTGRSEGLAPKPSCSTACPSPVPIYNSLQPFPVVQTSLSPPLTHHLFPILPQTPTPIIIASQISFPSLTIRLACMIILLFSHVCLYQATRMLQDLFKLQSLLFSPRPSRIPCHLAHPSECPPYRTDHWRSKEPHCCIILSDNQTIIGLGF